MKTNAWLWACAAVLLSACQTTQVATFTAATLALEDDEKKLWEDASRLEHRFEEVGLVYKDDGLEQYLRGVLVRVSSNQLHNGALELKIHVLRMADRNATTLPNGVFYVNLGLLASLDDESELASVLSHELAHFTRRHSLKETRTAANKNVIVNIVAATTLLTGLGPIFTGVGSGWARQAFFGYSRELELEADDTGLETTAEAGYDPHSAMRTLECLHEEDELEESAKLKTLPTHPDYQTRAEHCRGLLSARFADVHGELRRDEFLAHMRQPSLDYFREEIELGRLGFAEHAAEKFVANWPARAEGYYERGEVCRRRPAVDARSRAEAAYRAAIHHNPDFAEAHRELGLICRQDGRLAEARDEFAMCVALSPDALDAVILCDYIQELDANLAGYQP
jgi:predicted Zn-dependent protease